MSTAPGAVPPRPPGTLDRVAAAISGPFSCCWLRCPARSTSACSTVMTEALAVVGKALGLGELVFDDVMRQIPDHYHVHARPRPRWWPTPSSGGASSAT